LEGGHLKDRVRDGGKYLKGWYETMFMRTEMAAAMIKYRWKNHGKLTMVIVQTDGWTDRLYIPNTSWTYHRWVNLFDRKIL